MPKKPTRPVRTRTESEYNTTLKYLKAWKETPGEKSFAEYLLSQKKLSQATRIKQNDYARPRTVPVTIYPEIRKFCPTPTGAFSV